mmetsp:Transcript_19946/g.52942  ORF Transcript_19946/g.52942 Transcript_19946/m.52942 type:complete len:383 (-) Transcript_19946:222-1370(-)
MAMRGVHPQGAPLARSAIIAPIYKSHAQAVLPRPLRAASVASAAALQPTRVSVASTLRFAGACCLLQAAVLAPICRSLRRRPRKVATAAAAEGREKARVASAALRPSTKERLRELESIVGVDDEFGSFDEISEMAPARRDPASGARFATLPQELPRAIPFLQEPAYRAFAANVPGDAGFDPVGLCTDVEKFINYREAELKHGRLAMIAALAWPLAEEAEQILADEDSTITGIPDFLADQGGRMLPQLTGLGGFVEGFIALTFLIGGVFELTARRRGTEPGDVGFDPAGLRPWVPTPFQRGFIPKNRSWMGEAEVQHARLAMLAITYDLYDEITTGNPVIEDTEYFFRQLDNKFAEFEYSLSGAKIPEGLLSGEFPNALSAGQ